MLQALKVFGLGTLIWFGTILTIIVWTVPTASLTLCVSSPDGANVDARVGLGTGLSAFVFSPIPYRIIIMAAYGVAYWIVRAR
jgi:hypothetical protein